MECQIYVQTNIHLANIEVKRADPLGDLSTCQCSVHNNTFLYALVSLE